MLKQYLHPRHSHRYVELGTRSHQPSSNSRENIRRPWYRRYNDGAWTTIVWTGVGTSAAVMVANIVVLIIGLSSPADGDGARTLFRGSCNQSSLSYTAWHLLINLLSTVLLGASNAISQILAAPTRAEVDDAHQRGKCVHIGVFDFLNLRQVHHKRVILCTLIAISSIPLHLLYNSAIFNTTSIYNFNTYLVSPSFFNETSWSDYSPPGESLLALRSQARNGSLSHIKNHDCILLFGQDTISNISAGLLVTKAVNPSLDTYYDDHVPYSSTLPIDMIGMEPGTEPYDWICGYDKYCDAQKKASEPTWTLRDNEIDYCLVRYAPQRCALDLSVHLMITVIICNGVKLICFMCCLTLRDFEPLVTVGDAIVSFMERPDPTTEGLGCVSSRDVRRGAFYVHREAVSIAKKELPHQTLVIPGRHWNGQNYRYYATVGLGRWLSSAAVFGFILTVGIVLLSLGTAVLSQGTASFDHGFRFMSVDALPGNFNLFSAVFCANVFQLAVSNAYLLFNGCFTCLLLSKELSDFATQAKTMRVSKPKGLQRSTYWLQLPYRWSVPMMIMMALLHFLISEALFMINIQVLDMNGNRPDGTLSFSGSPSDMVSSFYGLAWNAPASLCAVIEGIVMIILLISSGLPKLHAGIPIMSSSSVAISAACHPSREEYGDATLRPVKYGVLETATERDPKPTGFSAGDVAPLEAGGNYGGAPDFEVTPHESAWAIDKLGPKQPPFKDDSGGVRDRKKANHPVSPPPEDGGRAHIGWED